MWQFRLGSASSRAQIAPCCRPQVIVETLGLDGAHCRWSKELPGENRLFQMTFSKAQFRQSVQFRQQNGVLQDRSNGNLPREKPLRVATASGNGVTSRHHSFELVSAPKSAPEQEVGWNHDQSQVTLTNPTNMNKKLDRKRRVLAMWYVLLAAVEDVETQRRGFCCLVNTKTVKISQVKSNGWLKHNSHVLV